MMRICIVATFNNPIAPPFLGGMEAHTWWLCKKLQERGHNVTLLASADSDTDLPQEVNVVPCIDRALFGRTFLGQDLKLADQKTPKGYALRVLREIAEYRGYQQVVQHLRENQYDIIHNNGLYYLTVQKAHTYKSPMLTHFHTPVLGRLSRAAAKAEQRGSSTFLAVSKAIAKLWSPHVTATTINNGIMVEHWPFGENPVAKSGIWCGRLGHEKAPHLAAQAAIKAGYSLDMYGIIDDQAYFDKEVAPLLSDTIRYGGMLGQDELAKRVANAAVMISTPLWEEPFGTVYMESLACGTPIVSFESGGTAEIVDEHTGIIVPKGDLDALVENIPVVAGLSRQACRNRAMEKFHVDRMIADYEAYYAKVMAEKGAKAATKRT